MQTAGCSPWGQLRKASKQARRPSVASNKQRRRRRRRRRTAEESKGLTRHSVLIAHDHATVLAPRACSFILLFRRSLSACLRRTMRCFREVGVHPACCTVTCTRTFRMEPLPLTQARSISPDFTACFTCSLLLIMAWACPWSSKQKRCETTTTTSKSLTRVLSSFDRQHPETTRPVETQTRPWQDARLRVEAVRRS
jgi:hypothetical protein